MAEEQLTKKERKALKKQEQEEHRKQREATARAATTKRWTIVIISAIVIVGFLAWLVNNAPERESLLDDTPDTINVIDETDNVKGASAENAKITIVEYSDFECPACASYFPILKQLVETYANDVRFVYRHLPLQHIHPNATLAARYAEAAGKQGQFFEMHDLIFENQGTWRGTQTRVAERTFKELAESLGLNIEQLEADANSDAIREKIEAHRIDAIGAGAAATPTFYVDGEQIENPRSYEEFEQFILERTGRAPADLLQIEDVAPTLEGQHQMTQ